jgi:hypothetical protein
LSAFPEDQAEIVQRFNKVVVPKGAQPLNKSTPEVRRIFRRCGWGDYTTFEKAALADRENWPKPKGKRPGFVALWHKYKPSPKRKRGGKQRSQNKSVGGSLLKGDIDALKARWHRWADRRDELFREDPKGTKPQRAKLEKQINIVAEELERRKVNVDAMRNQRAAARYLAEHEAVKNKPIFPPEVVTGLTTAWQVEQKKDAA